MITKVNISRITPPENRSKDIIADRELITFNFQEAKDLGNEIKLYDGDKITFFPILDIELNQVTISGHVVEPGIYSLSTYNDLKSLILDAAKGFLPDVYFDRVDVTSIRNGINIINSYNLNDVLSSNNVIELNDMDQVEVYSNERVEGAKFVSISGYGVENITTSWKENLTIYDLIFSATQINNPDFLTNLLKSRIDIKRFNNDTGLHYCIQEIKSYYLVLGQPRTLIKQLEFLDMSIIQTYMNWRKICMLKIFCCFPVDLE